MDSYHSISIQLEKSNISNITGIAEGLYILVYILIFILWFISKILTYTYFFNYNIYIINIQLYYNFEIYPNHSINIRDSYKNKSKKKILYFIFYITFILYF